MRKQSSIPSYVAQLVLGDETVKRHKVMVYAPDGSSADQPVADQGGFRRAGRFAWRRRGRRRFREWCVWRDSPVELGFVLALQIGEGVPDGASYEMDSTGKFGNFE